MWGIDEWSVLAVLGGAIFMYSIFGNPFLTSAERQEKKEEPPPVELPDGSIGDYIVVTMVLGDDGDRNDFAKLVAKRIREGYQPYGDMQVSTSQAGSFMGHYTSTRLTQPMVKKVDNKIVL